MNKEKELLRKIKNLSYKVDTTPWFFFKFVYVKKLKKVELEYLNIPIDEFRLNLCFKHRQEANHSHFHEDNCNYCKLLKTITENTKS